MLTLGDLAQIKDVEAPSGQLITITEEEEAQYVKDAIAAKIRSNMMWKTTISESAVNAVGSAVGLAAGGLLIGLLIGRRKAQGVF